MRTAMMAAMLVAGCASQSPSGLARVAEPIIAPCPAPPADPLLARLVAMAPVIAVGSLNIDAATLKAAAEAQRPDYVTVPLSLARMLKGATGVSPVLRYWPVETNYQPTHADLAAAASREHVLFLTPEGGALYLAGNSSLLPATSEMTDAVDAELARQYAIVSDWHAETQLPHGGEVARLIEQLAALQGTPDARNEQQRLFAAIEALGESAVPAIVSRMEDRRPLAVGAISLVNKAPDAFEARRHYVVVTIGDAMVAILNQLTGIYFVNYNRLSPGSLAGWRVYTRDLACGQDWIVGSG